MPIMVCKLGMFAYEHQVYIIEGDSVIETFRVTSEDAADRIATYAAHKGITEIQISAPVSQPEMVQPIADDIQNIYSANFGHSPRIDIKFI